MRLESHGKGDSGPRLRFHFDGKTCYGRKGDSLAAALIANDIRLVGRSFKYHRPRGIVTAGSDEPNALVTLSRNGQVEPNVRATTQELFNGLDAHSQNRWPSLRFDLLAGNDMLAPFIGAGFYYKTFMWPPSWWEVLYEPFIRRAAGLGTLDDEPAIEDFEQAHAFCEILVIGAGPAGLMAALTAGRAGARVILADEDFVWGGRLTAEHDKVDGMPGGEWAEKVIKELQTLPNVRLMQRTTVTGVFDGGVYAALERLGDHLAEVGSLPRQCFWRITARQAVLAAGAIERGIAFANNDRPGIMSAAALRSYVNRYGVAPGKRIAVFGNNDDVYRTADNLTVAGLEVAAAIDSRPAGHRHKAPYHIIPEGEVCATRGRWGVRGVVVSAGGVRHRMGIDCLAVAGGWNPAVHLTCHLGAKPEWQPGIAAFIPRQGAIPSLHPAGACRGCFSTHQCLKDGKDAAIAALEAIDARSRTSPKHEDVARMPLPQAGDEQWSITPLWHVPGRGRAWLDTQNDVTVKDVKQAATEGFRSVEHMKRYTTQGMTTDQGKGSNTLALAVLAEATGQSIPETGTTTFRPPYTPVAIAAMGGAGRGRGFAPERLAPSHEAVLSRRAPMIEAGLWYRPSYFPAPGETSWRQSCTREVEMVRTGVGVADVTTLGKIDIQGSDAGTFLDFVYTGRFSTLAVGKTRYGLMLREDGHVMDDGTTARLGEHHYLMTTTTAAAGQVMQHLDFVAQCLKPELDVRCASVTEQWAQFAVAGPRSRELLGSLVDELPALGFMGCAGVAISGVAGRMFRISFSGETGYEIAVPARYGDSLYRLLVAWAESLGGGAYGMEALNVLRIEKGFVTHAEIHGRVTAFDIGMQGMMSDTKDFIGKAAAARPGLIAPSRERLVGLRPVNPEQELTAGAHLFADGAKAVSANDEGYVTSSCYSPTVGSCIALGFLVRGPERHGEVVSAVDHLRGVTTRAEVTSPVFVDPNGRRMRD